MPPTIAARPPELAPTVPISREPSGTMPRTAMRGLIDPVAWREAAAAIDAARVAVGWAPSAGAVLDWMAACRRSVCVDCYVVGHWARAE